MGFSRQEYSSGLSFPSPGDLPHPGIEPGSAALQLYIFPHSYSGYTSTVFCSQMLVACFHHIESESVSPSVMSDCLRPYGLLACPAPLSKEFPRKEYWSGCHFLLQGIFLIQGSNPCLLHCRHILYCLSQSGKPPSSSWLPSSRNTCDPHLVAQVSLLTA